RLAWAGEFRDTAETVGATLFVVAELGEVGAGGDVRTVVTDLRARGNDRQAVVLGLGVSNGKPVGVIATTEAARTAGLQAGRLVSLACRELGGGGGGTPDLAQGGGSDPAAIPTAIASGETAIQCVSAAAAAGDGRSGRCGSESRPATPTASWPPR